jgi:hypothetical protein
MSTFVRTAEQISQLIEMSALEEAEEWLDRLAGGDLDQLDDEWNMGSGAARFFLSGFYNEIGANYRVAGMKASRQGDREGLNEAARCGERCHEKALDLYDIPAKDLRYLPKGSPLTKNALCTLWGLGGAKFVLGQHAESRLYL